MPDTSDHVPPAPTSPAATRGRIQALNLRKEYALGEESVPVLRGISMEVQAGETVFLCGPSGAGKSTLLYILGGLERPSSGQVLVDSIDFYALRDSERAQLRNTRMGYVFQNYGLLPEFTALENVALPALIGGKRSQDRAKELLERVGLGPRSKHLPAELSGGEQQRVAIARALINDPQFLFADEPTGNLDSKTGHAVMDILLGLVSALKKTLLVVTHDTHLATLGNRVLHLTDGQLCSSA